MILKVRALIRDVNTRRNTLVFKRSRFSLASIEIDDSRDDVRQRDVVVNVRQALSLWIDAFMYGRRDHVFVTPIHLARTPNHEIFLKHFLRTRDVGDLIYAH